MEKSPKNSDVSSKRRFFVEINYAKLSIAIIFLGIILLCIYSFLPLLNAALIAMIVSYLANPVVGFFERKQIPRILSVLLVFIIILVIGISLFFIIKMMIPSKEYFVEIQTKIMHGLDQAKNVTSSFLTERFGIDGKDIVSKIDFNSLSATFLGDFKFTGITAGIGKVISGVSNVATLIFISSVLLFFLLWKGRDFERFFLSKIPNKYFEMVVITWREVDRMFGNYIRGTLVESLVIGVLTFIGWYICGVAFGVAFIGGLVVGLLNAIPYIGPFMGGILGIIMYACRLFPIDNVSLFGISPNILNIVLIIVIVQVLDQVIKPLILSQSVELPGIVVFIGIIAGGKLFGFIGMVFAIPIIAVFKIIFGTLYKQLVGFGFLSSKIVSVVSVAEKDRQ
ncbi:MAG: AI-2E family transporter [Spirochaetales bacterium]|nr:AI-2E family transporter [Spirochaetales bacterium]